MSDRRWNRGDHGLTWHELRFPSNLTHDDVLGFTRVLAMRPRHGLLQQAQPLVIEVISTWTDLRWGLGTSSPETATVLPQLRGHLPGVRLDRLAERLLPGIDRAVELRLNTARRSLRSDTSDSVTTTLLTALNDVRADEALVLSWLIGPWLPRPVVKHHGTAEPGFGFERLVTKQGLDSEDASALKAKTSEPLLGVVGRIGVQADGPARQRQLVQRVLGALQLTRQPGVGLVTRWVGGRTAARRLVRLSRPLIAWPCPLNAAELATVLGWPIGNPVLRDVSYRGGRQLPPARGTRVSEATVQQAPAGRWRVIGRGTYPGQEGLLVLHPKAALQHLHVIGPTGSGKSVLLARLIETDLAAGRAVVVIEPKADLIAAVLDRLPDKRQNDVVLLDPTDRHHAVSLNLLRAPDPDLAVDQLLHVIRELNQSSWGPRTSQILHAGLLTLARAGDQTLAELPLLLTNPGFRRTLLSRTNPTTGLPVNDPLGTAGVWSWFESLSEAERSAVIGPSLNKLGAFLNRRAIRAIVGQAAPAFALHQVFTERRVLLVNLAKGVIGPESARLLGALVFSALWQTALGRSAIAPERRHPVMVYVDEFQDYVRGLPLDFGELLAQARGLGVGLTLAHQGLHQLDNDTRAAVLSNARSRVVFQASGAEARALASTLGGGLSADDLQALGVYEAYASLVVSGHPAPPASLRSLPPELGRGTAQAVRARSREQWAAPVAEVEAAILARRGAPDGAVVSLGGRRRRQP